MNTDNEILLISNITDIVCEYLNIDKGILLNRVRTQHKTDMVYICYLICYKLGCSYNNIGAYFGRNRTTVFYGVSRIKDLIDIDKRIKQIYEKTYDYVCKNIRGEELCNNKLSDIKLKLLLMGIDPGRKIEVYNSNNTIPLINIIKLFINQ